MSDAVGVVRRSAVRDDARFVGNDRVLFGIIRELTAQGVAVIYISHRLAEIREIGDRVTVLKDGRTVATGLPARETKTSELIGLMTGRVLDNVFPQRKPVDPAAPEVLVVRGLADGDRFTGVDLTVHAGEVVGLAGLVGSGRSEILETLYGARKAAEGTVEVDGRKLRRGSVGAAVRAGMGLCPEERKSQGLLLDQAVYRNITVSSMSAFARFGFIDDRAERARSTKLTEALDVRPAGVDRVVRGLSRRLVEVPVGFKWFAPGLFDGSFCFGGEESAGASFLRQDGRVWTTDKDGLILGLLAAEITATTGKDPGVHYQELTAKYGSPCYTRIDAAANAHLYRTEIERLTGEPLVAPTEVSP